MKETGLVLTLVGLISLGFGLGILVFPCPKPEKTSEPEPKHASPWTRIDLSPDKKTVKVEYMDYQGLKNSATFTVNAKGEIDLIGSYGIYGWKRNSK